MKPEFSKQIYENPQISTFMKIHTVGSKMYHADGYTDKEEVTVAFCNFANAPKNRD